MRKTVECCPTSVILVVATLKNCSNESNSSDQPTLAVAISLSNIRKEKRSCTHSSVNCVGARTKKTEMEKYKLSTTIDAS